MGQLRITRHARYRKEPGKPAWPMARLENSCCSPSAHKIYLTPQTSMR
jgi:hypothetical protein